MIEKSLPIFCLEAEKGSFIFCLGPNSRHRISEELGIESNSELPSGTRHFLQICPAIEDVENRPSSQVLCAAQGSVY